MYGNFIKIIYNFAPVIELSLFLHSIDKVTYTKQDNLE